ncbi:peptidase S8/S53 domain-containing protein, partial [Thamnocephalis sphaerospora]
SLANWGLDRIDQVSLPLDGKYWYPESAGAGVNVYIVDTGINVNHVDFGGRAKWGRSFIEPTNSLTDDQGHGTMVASLVGGATYGVAKNATLIAVKVLDTLGMGTNVAAIKGLHWIWQQHRNSDNKRTVVNMSLGGMYDPMMNRFVETLIKDGATVVAGAGNGYNGQPQDACSVSPGSAKGIINVGATDKQDRSASFSNYGK